MDKEKDRKRKVGGRKGGGERRDVWEVRKVLRRAKKVGSLNLKKTFSHLLYL